MKTIADIKKGCKVKYRNMLLSALREDEIDYLRRWRNDINQTQFLRKITYITEEKQLNWFKEYLNDDSQITFAIYENDELKRIVGSVSLYNINLEKKTAEVGRIQIGDAEAHGRGLGRISLVGAIKVAFQYLNVEVIEASVHKNNIAAHKNDMMIGFRIVGEKESVVGGIEDLLEMREDDAIKANSYYSQIEITFC